jgi:hypothetical protein
MRFATARDDFEGEISTFDSSGGSKPRRQVFRSERSAIANSNELQARRTGLTIFLAAVRHQGQIRPSFPTSYVVIGGINERGTGTAWCGLRNR